MTGFEAALARRIPPGTRVGLGDGLGTPRCLHGPLSRVAADRDVRLLLGWVPGVLPDLRGPDFADIRVLVGGAGVRAMVDDEVAHLVPTRLSAVPSLLAGRLRPDLLLATLVRRRDGLHFGTEIGWQRGIVDAGVPVIGVVATSRTCADAGPPVPPDAVEVIGETDERPAEITTPPPTPIDVAVAEQVAALIPEGARVQVGPGRLAGAIVSALRVPVRIDSGLLPDVVVELDERGLLLGDPVATYLGGSQRLSTWADGRPVLRPVEFTHDVGRLAAPEPAPLIAINSALEIDVDGQVNVEGFAHTTAGMIGGHPDFAGAAVRGAGLSVIALGSRHRGRSTLVERLARPVTTGAHDVDVIVTEHGTADLRGRSRRERRRMLLDLWDGVTVRDC